MAGKILFAWKILFTWQLDIGQAANKGTLKVSTMSDNSLSAESRIFIIELKYRMCTSIGIEGDMTICFLEQIETSLQFGVILSLYSVVYGTKYTKALQMGSMYFVICVYILFCYVSF